MSYYRYYPSTKWELVDNIKDIIEETESYICDLNSINTSNITDMATLFRGFGPMEIEELIELEEKGYIIFSRFDGDISNWNVSKVETMMEMFEYSNYTGMQGSIADWDIRNVKDMRRMFANSLFRDKTIIQWFYKIPDLSKVQLDNMLSNTPIAEDDAFRNQIQNEFPEIYSIIF